MIGAILKFKSQKRATILQIAYNIHIPQKLEGHSLSYQADLDARSPHPVICSDLPGPDSACGKDVQQRAKALRVENGADSL